MRRTNIPFFLIVAAGLLIMPSDVLSQAQEATSDLPQVAQPLVREGDFAIKLVEALKMGKAEDEAQAESLLVAAGIEPRNGWISDYPVAPDVIGQLQESITASAGSGKLAMTEEEALDEFQTLCASLGLSIVAGTSGPGEGNEPEADLSQYDIPTVVNSYYYEYGPPIVTYYAPPPDYYYLYSWVPYPFWYGGFFFSGFFCLNHFNKIVIVKDRHKVVTNRVFDNRSHSTVRIDPATRSASSFARSQGISGQRDLTPTEGTGAGRGLRGDTSAREFGRLPGNPRGSSGQQAGATGSESSGRHVGNSSGGGRHDLGDFGNHGSPRDSGSRMGALEGRGSGRDSRSDSFSSSRGNSSGDFRSGARAFGNQGSSRDFFSGANTFGGRGSGRDFRSGSARSSGSGFSGEFRGGARASGNQGSSRGISAGTGTFGSRGFGSDFRSASGSSSGSSFLGGFQSGSSRGSSSHGGSGGRGRAR